MLRLGVAGVGSLGFHHARILRDLDGVAAVTAHDTDPDRLVHVATELQLETRPDLPSLLDSIDALVVAVPTSAHEEVALQALERGMPVLIEKPIAADLEEADRILGAAESAGAMVQIGHVERFNGVLRACEPYLESPLFIESHRLAPFRARGTDVAVVLDLMIHDLDLVLSIVGQDVRGLSATGVPVLSPSADIANARIEFEGGCVANLTASRVSLERKRKFRFFQPSGYVSLDLDAGVGEFLRIRSEAGFAPGVPLPAARLEDAVERVTLRSDGGEPLRHELESFLKAIRGMAAVSVSGEDGRRALATALDIMKQIESNVALARST
ncbi:MAG: Gfo/Idh/MocA family oxidoreductase [Gemmatimonadota bacterium]